MQGAAELKVSAFLLDLAIRNVKGEITHDEVNQRLKERYGATLLEEPRSGLDGVYDIIPPDSPRIKEIEEHSGLERFIVSFLCCFNLLKDFCPDMFE